MGLYNKQGLYAGYKKNNKEREALDYYATPPSEVTNILEIIQPDLHRATILEPCAGQGHMVKGILDYIYNSQKYDSKLWKLIATDVADRGILEKLKREDIKTGLEYDFLSDDYPYNKADYVIMNPPYATIEPFVIRALEIAQKGVLLLGRIQFIEGISRYNNILKDNPPTDVYVYIDRIKCGKNGNFADTEAIQCYAWFYWDKTIETKNNSSTLHWIHRT